MADLLRAAQWYARRGLHVFPCRVRAKEPATGPGGFHNASTNERVIAEMWRSPAFNVGIACGLSKLCVVDPDGKEGAESLAALEVEHGPLPRTPTVRTANGHHHYFRGAVRSAKLARKVDVKSIGGYVLAPPSVHPDGPTYQWEPGLGIHQVELALLPQWIVDALAPRESEQSAEPIVLDRERVGAYAHKALSDECAAVCNAPQGERNETLNRAAFNLGTLVGAGVLDASLVRGVLIEAGRRAGLSARESLATANSGLSAGMREPRRLAS